MNDKNTHSKGQHLGSVHADPIIHNEIYRMNIKGWDTCLISEYEAMIAQGVEPDIWRLAP